MRVIKKYFRQDHTVIVYYDLDQELFNKVVDINHIGMYEKPDILSIFDNKIVGIEHFEFDSFKKSGKGSDFRIKDGTLKRDLQKTMHEELLKKDSTTVCGHIDSTCSLSNYFNNFKKIFLDHYEKIDSYIEHIEEDYGTDKEISICFFAEDVTPLGNYFMNRKNSMHPCLLNPLYSDEIIQLLRKCQKVKYLIIGTCAMGEDKLIIIENKKAVLDKFLNERPQVTEENYFSFSVETLGFAVKEELK